LNVEVEVEELSADADINNRRIRQLDLISPEMLDGLTVVVVGCGAIGSWAAKFLAQLGVRSIALIDYDTVSAFNLALQGFTPPDLGKLKVDVLRNAIADIDSDISVRIHGVRLSATLLASIRRAATTRYKDKSKFVVFSCVDSIPARRTIYEALLPTDSLFVDARMGGFTWECMTIDQLPSPYYERWVYEDVEAYARRCTDKGTVFVAASPASIMTSQLTMWLKGGRTSNRSLARYIKFSHMMPLCEIDNAAGQD